MGQCQARVSRQFGGQSLAQLELSDKPLAVKALSALFDYLSRTQITGLERMNEVDIGTDAGVMGLDINARRNLELTETLRNKEKRGSLLWVLDRTKTAMGKRLIKAWLEQPLLSPAKITRRQNAVEELFQNPQLLDQLTEQLTGIYDLERIMTPHCLRLGQRPGAALSVPRLSSGCRGLLTLLEGCQATLLQQLRQEMGRPGGRGPSSLTPPLWTTPPFTIREGGHHPGTGYNQELDEVKRDMNGGRELIAAVEARRAGAHRHPQAEKPATTGCSAITSRCPTATKNQVPEDYIRKQTLTGGERYITQELKDLEKPHSWGAPRQIHRPWSPSSLRRVRRFVADQLPRGAVPPPRAVAALDVLCSFAVVSVKNDYTRAPSST